MDDGRIKITLEMDGTRVDGSINGHAFAIARNGCATKLEGIKTNDSVLGSIIASKLLDFCGDIMDGLNILIDETDGCQLWKPMPNDIADDVRDAIS